MKNANVPSPSASLGGVVYFPRMLEKIRQQAAGTLAEDLQANLGKGFDSRCVNLLQVEYAELATQVQGGLNDEAALDWCFTHGRRPTEEDIEVWSEFMRKRGWKDEASPILQKRLAEGGWSDRADIETMFQYIDLDEGRDPAAA